MNKVMDQRLVPNGEYIDALNIRMGSTENSEIGVASNTKGNSVLTDLKYINGTSLSSSARTIGAFADSANETLYWFVHDPDFSVGATGKLDLIVSYNTVSETLSYHIISINDGGDVNTTLNFDPEYLITGVNKVDDLIFFVQFNNPPRFFNVKRNYPVPVANEDDANLGESILVIKKPPIESPSVRTYLTNGQENFIDTRFICFAYRYRYADNEYSAISQFSQPAFTPNPFNFSIDSYLNEGMVNLHNTAEVTFNTGGPLVVGIDLLFKEADNNTLKVIEKLNKADLGYADDVDITYIFNNSKIFTVLPSHELLRLYDNVPRFAKAQTLMGNRLMYGNYIEGYDLFDEDAQAVQLAYTANPIEEEIGNATIPDSLSSGTYNINGAQIIPESVLNIDLSGLTFPLNAGGSISLDISLTHASFSGGTLAEQTDEINIFFTFLLLQDYTSAYHLATSTEFVEAIGVVGGSNGIQTTVATYCDGNKLTDEFNCNVPNTLDSYSKLESGINTAIQPISVIAGVPTTASQVIGLQFPAMRFVDNVTTPTASVYEYYKVSSAQATYQEIANPTSLHSNRSYEIGIVYQDEFLRSTTALVSPMNTVFFPCGNAELRNTIQVTIPTNQKPPSWATRYKFVIKADVEGYNTIYSSIFFNDPLTNATYMLLEGENAKKVEAGDRYIVKRDTEGALQNCVYATILEKESQAAGFIEIPTVADPSVFVPVPAGVYAKINSNNFSTIATDDNVVSSGTIQVRADAEGEIPILYYPINVLDTITNQYVDYTIPAGSQIQILFKFERLGGVGSCDIRKYTVEKTLISTTNYINFQEWWEGDKIDIVINQGVAEIRSGTCEPENRYNPVEGDYTDAFNVGPDPGCINMFQFVRNPSDQRLYLGISGTPTCYGTYKVDKRQSKIWANITVFRALSVLVFETEPVETLPDVFYENNLSYPITNGNHMGIAANGDTNQNIAGGVAGVINTGFFNCYSFGNGVESYKIRDSIVGKTFNFGNKVTAVAAQDYKEAHRFADMTYSGIYNNETNVNKLNEFNLGLANFKPLENSFGPIQILDARETDVLVLQEDKISYVLAGKNLLSDAAAGSLIASVPEVLGTQIARTEEYGISDNPESYVNWGYNRYFTDVKRGAVIRLRGGGSGADELTVISEAGMRTYFRDLFIATNGTQHLGGYDPFMDEYVLSTNDISLPVDTSCISCGMRQIFNVDAYQDVEFCINAGRGIGELVIEFSGFMTDVAYEVIATYNGVEVTSGLITGSGSIVVNKNDQNIEQVDILVQSVRDMTLTLVANCPLSDLMTVVQVCVTNDADAFSFIHNDYRYINGTYTSPTSSTQVYFASGTDNPLVTYYNSFLGNVGSGSIPNAGSSVRMTCNKSGFDDFDFDPAKNSFKYLVSSTLYTNTPADIAALLLAANTATPNAGSGNYQYADFTMPGPNTYFYMIWDYRGASVVELCYGETASDSCCECAECTSDCAEYFISNTTDNTVIAYTDCYTGLPDTLNTERNHGYFLCSQSVPTIDLGIATIKTVSACGCDSCADSYGGGATFEVTVLVEGNISYTPCGGSPIVVNFEVGTYQFSTSGDAPVGTTAEINITFVECGCS